MCGRKPCRACAQKARVSGTRKRKKMARRRKKGDIAGQLTNVALAGAGYLVADQVNKLPFVSSNPQIGNFVKLGIGTYLAMTQRNPMLVSAAQGMALNGALGAARQYGIVSGIGQIALPGGMRYGGNSTAIPGVAGSIKVR